MDAWGPSRKVEDMNFLLLCRPAPGIDATIAFRPHLADELEALRALRDQGILSSAYTPDGPGAVLLIDVPTAADAESVAAALPMRIAGLIDVDVITLRPVPGL
jgi:hypothetical protein